MSGSASPRYCSTGIAKSMIVECTSSEPHPTREDIGAFTEMCDRYNPHIAQNPNTRPRAATDAVSTTGMAIVRQATESADRIFICMQHSPQSVAR
jgi:hypothetical protein